MGPSVVPVCVVSWVPLELGLLCLLGGVAWCRVFEVDGELDASVRPQVFVPVCDGERCCHLWVWLVGSGCLVGVPWGWVSWGSVVGVVCVVSWVRLSVGLWCLGWGELGAVCFPRWMVS